MSDECMIREYEKREKNGKMRGVIRIDINFEGLILRPIYLYILLSIFFFSKVRYVQVIIFTFIKRIK